MENHNINPWVRANMHEPNGETLELIPPSEQQRYESILKEIGNAAAALNEVYSAIPEAQARYAQAFTLRDAFFKDLGAY